MLGAAPFDWQLGNSYFVIAHFHYVILGVIVFAVFAASYYWYPKVTGRMLSETLGKWHFWLFLIGFHVTFDFMHIPGLLGMPRRIYTYDASRGWEIWNLIVSIGVIFQIAGDSDLGGQCGLVVLQGQDCGQRSLGRLDAGVGDDIAAAGLQLRDIAGGAQPASAVGFETSGRSGLEVRVDPAPGVVTSVFCFEGRDRLAATTIAVPQNEMPLSAHLRGKVGMWCLIRAESAIFSIFVVAYLYYAGKSLSGPNARRKCSTFLYFTSICLFSSSLTILLAEKALHRGNIKRFGTVLAAYHRAGRDLSDRHGARMARPDLRRRLDDQHQPVRHDILFTGRAARLSRDRGRSPG